MDTGIAVGRAASIARAYQRRTLYGFSLGSILYDYLDSQELGVEAISLADAKARLSALVDQVEAGNSVDITRRGKPVARLTAIGGLRKPIDMVQLEALTAALPAQR